MIDSSLDDIKRALFPSFTLADIDRLDSNTTLKRDVYGVSYLPGRACLPSVNRHSPTRCTSKVFSPVVGDAGFVGLNNLKNTDHVNVVIQALAHVIPVRNYFMQPTLYEGSKAQLVGGGQGRVAGSEAWGLTRLRLNCPCVCM